MANSRALGLLLAASPVAAQEPKLEWVGRGARFDSYRPRHVPLATERPKGVTAVPRGVTRPVRGQLLVGPAETRLAYTLLIDGPEGGEHRLWVDANGNGDLTDDPPVAWTPSRRPGTNTSHSGAAVLKVRYGSQLAELELYLYRVTRPRPGETHPSLFCYRLWGWTGTAVLGGRSYRAILDEEQSSGDFRGTDASSGSGVSLLLDVNGDDRLDPRAERLDVRRPFNVGG